MCGCIDEYGGKCINVYTYMYIEIYIYVYIYIYSDGLRLRTKNSFQNITKQKKILRTFMLRTHKPLLRTPLLRTKQ